MRHIRKTARMNLISATSPTTTSVTDRYPRHPLGKLSREGVEKKLKKTKPKRCGAVAYKPLRSDCFEFRYCDESGRDTKFRRGGISAGQARTIADNLNRVLLTSEGAFPNRRSSVPAIADVIAEAIRLAGTRKETALNRARAAKQFEKWIKDRHPAVKTWGDLRPAHLVEFQLHLEERKLARDTIRLTLEPIRFAWRHALENWPDDVKPLPRLKLKKSAKRKIECLEPNEIAVLLDWLKENAPDLWPMATLQALAGLRVLEAEALRVQDVNFESGLIRIEDTGRHVPKNESSRREIPVCVEVIGALQWAIKNQKIVPTDGSIFLNKRGTYWKRTALGHRWTAVLRRAADATETPRLKALPCRKLRSAFATMVSRMGATDRLVKAYMGHSPSDVLYEFYRAISAAELKSVSGLMNGWRGQLKDQESGKKLETSQITDLQAVVAQ